MSATVQLDVPVLLPEVNDRGDRCVVLLASELRVVPGILRVHVPGDLGSLRFCIHHDPALIDAAEVERLARERGARMTAEIGHLLWAVAWIEDERTARRAGEGLRHLTGVIGAEATPAGVVRVQYDRRRIDSGAIERTLHALGLGREIDRARVKPRRGLARRAEEVVSPPSVRAASPGGRTSPGARAGTRGAAGTPSRRR
jgi:Zn2+/Cd2+-exporting ATPase